MKNPELPNYALNCDLPDLILETVPFEDNRSNDCPFETFLFGEEDNDFEELNFELPPINPSSSS